MLLSRKDFREAVFERDKVCVFCKGELQDAHHLIERRLWPDEGYYLDNGVGLCGACHLDAERTDLSPDLLRKSAGIDYIHLPSSFDNECQYDKWGNFVWEDGTRSPGPLFNDPSVQKVLNKANKLKLFKRYYRHARTLHLPWSPNRGQDGDKIHQSDETFLNKEVIITLKLDGEQTSFYSDYYHARSIESSYHSSRTWVANLYGSISHEIPEGYRLVGENLFAQHSIAYRDLPSYFFLFAIFNENNICLSWDETIEWAELLKLETVPVLHRSTYERARIENFEPAPIWSDETEGYVMRWSQEFSYFDWNKAVGKSVRANHVKTDQHWRHRPFLPNQLR